MPVPRYPRHPQNLAAAHFQRDTAQRGHSFIIVGIHIFQRQNHIAGSLRPRLLDEAGGITKLRAAEPSELRAFSWRPDAVADGVWEALHGIPVADS